MDLFGDPHAAGQAAAQGAGIKPVAAPALPNLTMGNARNANLGIPASAGMSMAPAAPSSEEPTFSPAAAPVPGKEGSLLRTQAIQQQNNDAAAARVKAIGDTLGDKFDPASGDSSVWQRFRLGMMGNQGDRAKYLQDNLPPGSEVKQINVQGVGPVTVFRQPGDPAWRPVRGTSDVAGRIGDVLSGVPSVGAQVGMAAATGGDSLLYRLFTQALAGAGERGLELEGNRAAGYNSNSGGGDVKDAAGSAAAATAGELAGTAGANMVGKGGGVFAPTDVGAERLAAQKILQDFDPNLRALTAFQLGHPLLEAKGNRLAAVNPTIGNIAGQQGNTLSDLISKSVTTATGGGAPAIGDKGVQVGNILYPGLADVVQAIQDKAAAGVAHVPETEATEGGRALGDIYRNAIAPVVQRTNARYGAVADRMGNAPQYENGVVPIDLSATHGVIDKEAAPVYGQGVPEPVPENPPLTVANGADDEKAGFIKDLKEMLSDPAVTGEQRRAAQSQLATLQGWGDPHPAQLPSHIQTLIDGIKSANDKHGVTPYVENTPTELQPTDVQVGGGIHQAIQDVVDRLRALNPQNGLGPMSERAVAPYDALKGIRSKLGETSQFNPLAPGADRATSTQAGRIMAPLDTAIDTAAGPAGQAAKASRRFQSDILDNPDAIAARDAATPESNMKYADPKNRTFLANSERLAKATGQAGKFGTFTDALKTSFKRDPALIDNFLHTAATSPDGAERLLGGDADAFKQFAADTAAMKQSPAYKAMGNADYSARARDLIANTDAKGLGELVQQGGGQNSAIGSNLRGAMFQHILENSLNNEGKVDMGRAMSAVSSVIKDGRAAAVLTPEELTRLQAIRTYAAGGDAMGKGLGSSIYGSEMAGGALTPTNVLLAPRQFLKALGDLAEARFQNWTWTSGKGTKFLFGQPGGAPPKAITGGAAAAGVGAVDYNRERQE